MEFKPRYEFGEGEDYASLTFENGWYVVRVEKNKKINRAWYDTLRQARKDFEEEVKRTGIDIMSDKQTILEILRNIRDKKKVENNPRIGLCDLFGGEANVVFRTHYGVYPLKTNRSLLRMFEQTAQAVLGYEVKQHAFWLLPLDEQGDYTLPNYTCLDGVAHTPMSHPVTGQLCSVIYTDEPERLTSARLKLLDDMIAYLERN